MTHEKKARAGRSSVQQKPPSPTARRLDDLVSNKAPHRAPPSRARLNGPQRIPIGDLEQIIEGAICHTDEMVMRSLRERLSGLADRPVSAFIERKLLPHRIANALGTAEMFSKWMVLARAAQAVTGVPASMLLAEISLGPNDPCSDPNSGCPVPGNDLFKRGKKFPSLGAALLDHASYLATEPRFQRVMLAKDDPVRYVAAVGACKLWEELGRRDRARYVREFQDCDDLPIEAIYN